MPEKIVLDKDRSTIHCSLCGTDRALKVTACRNSDWGIVGWLFICSDCEDKLGKSTVMIEMGHRITS